MNNLKPRPKFTIIGVRGLVLIYLLLILLTILFSQTFMSELLHSGEIPEIAILGAFFVIPAALFVLFITSGIGIIRTILAREPGSRFQMRLFGCFFIVVALSATPVILISSLSVSELLRFWRTIDVDKAMVEAQRFAMETYSLKLEKLQRTAEENIYNEEVLGIQEFRLVNNVWVHSGYTGMENQMLDAMPYRQRGFAPREIPRDIDVIRYTVFPEPDYARVFTMDLGNGFDYAAYIIENEKNRFNIIDSIRFNIGRLLFFYYGVFFLPTLLMSMIIGLSLSHKVAWPIEELTEATKRVAEGDFSIRISPRKGDELALLIRSFNVMVTYLEKSRTALLDTEKVAVWQELAQRLAHELKNPLTPIRLSAERVLRRWRNEPERTGEILENSMLAIIQEVEGLNTLLGDFRTMSKPTNNIDALTCIYESVEGVVNSYSVSHSKIKFNIEHVSRDISLRIEKHRLSQILTNLIINAIDAMNGQGTIIIRSDLVKKGEEGYCRLSIQDSGAGISKEDAAKIFHPYYTTKESGTGLGLPIIERIVKDHGGIIWFDTAENAGTTFYIDLPLEKDK